MGKNCYMIGSTLYIAINKCNFRKFNLFCCPILYSGTPNIPTRSKQYSQNLQISLGVYFGNCYNKRNSGYIIKMSEVTIYTQHIQHIRLPALPVFLLNLLWSSSQFVTMNFFREVVRRDVYLEETIKCNVRMDSNDNLNLGLLGRFSVTK